MNLKKYILIFLFSIGLLNVMGQGTPGGGTPGGGEPGGPLDPGSGEPPLPEGAVPFEGIGILLAAGAGYGAKKVYDYKKKRHKAGESGSPKV